MKRVLPFLLLCAVCFAAPLQAAFVRGKISFISKRGQSPAVAETLVWLEPMAVKNIPRRAPAKFQLVTRNKTVIPHVLAVPVGSTVDFPNEDPISHNLFSLSNPNNFDVGLYRKGAGKSRTFTEPGIVNVYCNVHSNMSAVIHVLSTPYYAFADAGGNYALGDIPAGRYRLVAWNEQGGRAESTLEVAANGAIAGDSSLTLDSRNVRIAPHTNKEGKAYAPLSTVKDY